MGVALLGAANAVEAQSGVQKTGDWFVDKTAPPTAAITPSSGYFGADEDDVMNNIFNHYAVPITNAAGQPTGHKVLYKDGCQKACAEILLVTKQVSEAKMDLNNSGEIDITESHTFMRSLLGRLNQFVLAPGSLTTSRSNEQTAQVT